MRWSFLSVETILLLCVGLLGLLFILQECEDEVEKTVSHPVHLERMIRDPPDQKIKWNACPEDKSVYQVGGFSKLPEHIQNFMRYRHCRSFPQVLNTPQKCGGKAMSEELFLLLAIKSSPGNYERRAVIRQTWGQERSYNGVQVKTIFLCGTSRDAREDRHLRQLLKIESEAYKDILQWDFHDSFFNLTLKQILFHQWLHEYCPGAHFIFNGDDDVFVNTFNVITYLNGLEAHRHLYVGQLVKGGPIRESRSKYYIPVQLLSSNTYPLYCGGGGIIMSRYSAQAIYNASLDIPLFPIDDVYLGMCLEKAGLTPGYHMGIRTMGVYLPTNKEDSFHPCYYKELLMVHRLVPYQMLVMWKAIQYPLNCGHKLSV
ncbi:acetylgalactosaminyl-O-glycosyl-glycoprotein beta-1,3-N-acetylglucosaminyltransferase-like [Hyperolius riggenbachi]|uniref:acetylgalactosaminyl-O-glycosyl-glycoprotein beta-1,3-N-acetylglucosaminyltransferase-like n=1 Tax=Hyperolius riggenbachi TaxID=752182 RepID=UPI0035A26470